MNRLRRARHLGPPSALAAPLALAAAALLPASAGAIGAPQAREGRPAYDQRAAAASIGAATVAPNAAARSLARQLGPEGVVELDPVTDTPRRVLRTDGALTGTSGDAPAEIALRYVREHRSLFHLDDAAIAALGTPEDVVSPSGVHRLSWTQRHDGVPVAGAGLRAHVAADGRLLAVLGGPLPHSAVASTAPRLSAAGALSRVRRDAGAPGAAPAVTRSGGGAVRRTTFADDSTAQLVVYPAAGGNRLAWQVMARADSTHVWSYTVDATSGAVLSRTNMVKFASARGRAWRYVPSPVIARNGGDAQVLREFGADWILDETGSQLFGDNAFAYTDVNGDNTPALADQVAARSGAGTPADPFVWDYPFTGIETGGLCSTDYPCSWTPATSNSWQAHLKQNAVQAFWFVNRFHEHLKDPPIGFDEASGNFEHDDVIVAETSDGANTAGGRPDGDHLNNANMLTLPDGEPSFMQMYLFGGAPFVAGNGGDDAGVVYHEYTHGLTNRLVTDTGAPDGDGALWFPQAGALGEAWSDWYALDLLEAEGSQADDLDTDGEIVLGGYLTRNENVLREAALDCPVGATAANCAGGGFTFGDYGRVWDGGVEVHADGEIWAQTLWELRSELIRAAVREAVDRGDDPVAARAAAIDAGRTLVTEGLRSTAPQPSFLAARDAIVQAASELDEARSTGTRYHDLTWSVFARRGMGWSAATVDAYDPAPFEAFDTPPADGAPTAPLRGTVTDGQTGQALAGATVRLPGNSSVPATTGADGRYVLDAIVDHRYPRLIVTRPGYDDAAPAAVAVATGGGTRDVALRRNFALTTGGAVVMNDVTPPDYGAPCAPENAFDGTLAHGWASYAPTFGGIAGDPSLPVAPLGPRQLTLRLPHAVDVSSIAIDPGANCGDDDTASLGEFRIDFRDGGAWRTARRGTFGADANHRLNAFEPYPGTAAGVTDVLVTMISPQGGRGESFERFMDMAELAIHGSPTRPTEPPPPPPPPPGPDPQPRPPEPEPGPQPRPQPGAVDRRAPRLSGLRLGTTRRALTALRGRAGLRVRLRCDEPCSVAATVTLPAATARKLGLTRVRRGNVTLARAATRGLASANRTVTLKLTVSRRVAARLARVRSLKVSIGVRASDRAGNATTRRLTPTLRR